MSTAFAPSRLARPLLLTAAFLGVSALGVALPVAESHHRCWHKSQCSEPVEETTEPAPDTTEPAPDTTEPAPDTTEPAPDTTALWHSGFEGGILDDWLGVQEIASDHQVRADDYAPREGLRSARFELQADDALSSDGTARQKIYGAQLADGSHRRFYAGDDLYFGFSMRLRDDYPLDTNKWQSLVGWKNDNAGQGPLKLDTSYGSDFRLEGPNGNTVYWRGPVVRGVWLDFVVRVKFSTDPQVGFMEVWYKRPGDGYAGLKRQTMVNGSERQYAATMTSGSNYSYLKAGLYRETSFSTPSVAWFDAWRIASSFEGAAPR